MQVDLKTPFFSSEEENTLKYFSTKENLHHPDTVFQLKSFSNVKRNSKYMVMNNEHSA